jgi:hypothetical protein
MHKDDIEGLAASVGATPQQTKAFIATHRTNGNIDAVSAYINDHPGVTLAEIEAAATEASLDPTVALNIVKLLVFVGVIEEF